MARWLARVVKPIKDRRDENRRDVELHAKTMSDIDAYRQDARDAFKRASMNPFLPSLTNEKENRHDLP